ncbi:hypothetical protein [uncultured Methanolobus sp.]|nr:hypothetical protein [uncultured Methanolobus sp.]
MGVSQRSREIANLIYIDNPDLLEHDAKFGSDWNKRVAITILQLAGVPF